ncbi:MAG: DUF4236 domain-containing protein [Mobilitalea sp.]
MGEVFLGFRFFKRVSLLPGVTMNFSKSGPSFSFGPRGLKYTIGPKGTRSTFGIPGTGLYYTTSNKWNKKDREENRQDTNPVNSIGIFQQMLMSPDERQLVHGLQAMLGGNIAGAKEAFSRGSKLLDCTFLYGYLALGEKNYSEAEDSFFTCFSDINNLGKSIVKVDANFHLLLDITEYIEAPICIDGRGLGLSMLEALQNQKKHNETFELAEELSRVYPTDNVIRLIAINFIAQSVSSTKQELNYAIELSNGIKNEEPIDTNVLYLRGYVLYRLNLVNAAINQLTVALRKTKNRSEELLIDIRFLRGQIFEILGEKSKARKDYEIIFANYPEYQDVAKRLGIK